MSNKHRSRSTRLPKKSKKAQRLPKKEYRGLAAQKEAALSAPRELQAYKQWYLASMQEAVRANVLQSVDQLRHGSAVLGQLAQEDGLRIVGAEYSLESGAVDFFETGPLPA